MNVVVLRGTLSSPPTVRTLPSGDDLVALEVTTRPPVGPAESVPVSLFGAPPRVRALVAGAEVVVTGRIRRRFFRVGATTTSRTEVVADAVVPASQRTRATRAVEQALARVQEPPSG